MKLVIVTICLCLLSCGKSRTNPEPAIQPSQSELSATAIDWVSLRTALLNVREDLNRLNPPNTSKDDICFRLGHVLGRSEAISLYIETNIANETSFSTEKRGKILAEALVMRTTTPNFYASCQNASSIDGLATTVDNLYDLILSN